MRCIWKLLLRGYCAGNYMHGVMCIGKRVNAKVRNYDLRDVEKDMNGSVHGCKVY